MKTRKNPGIGLVTITIPTRWAKVSPIVPVPQHTSNSNVSGPKAAQSPASEYSFSAARVLTCRTVGEISGATSKNYFIEQEMHNNLSSKPGKKQWEIYRTEDCLYSHEFSPLQHHWLHPVQDHWL
jgi:hypothetical protein